ncbi:MAG: ABC transporter ATP-binding protein [Chloroflexota bacterium]
MRVTKALAREERDLDEFQNLSTDMYHASYRASWLSALFLPVVQLITAFGVAAVILFGGLQVTGGTMTIGEIQAFISYILFMMWPVQEMARVYAQIQQSIASAVREISLIDAVPEVRDMEGGLAPLQISGDIVFEDVEFYYEAGKPVLEDFNLHVRQGETIALVGPTGGGKSTIVNLLCRFYEPKEGRVLLNGMDYTGLTQQAIQSRVGMVLQTVGEGGNLLSVGQKQLISLARAILAKPDIFIMDEATSSVDTLTEALIQQGMEAVMAGRTSFIIAHRLSTIKRADRILVIENGRITESGTHGELIRQQGHYYSLYTNQFRREREAAYEDLAMAG